MSICEKEERQITLGCYPRSSLWQRPSESPYDSSLEAAHGTPLKMQSRSTEHGSQLKMNYSISS
jgi:hypothetical protein